ncbi:MAG: hypothetical protein JJE27_00730 [Thermoleophilia bacterium]|nr:hypothetical protein [Thermoleophilia bacterium]
MSLPVRARFAPSPTGPLHVGSARTALLNWLFVHSPAAGAGARLLLRIDDTDRERSDAALEAAIMDDLRWLGLTWDDGPVRQSERAARHAQALAALPTTERDGAREFDGRVIARADGSPLYNLAAAVDDLDDGITHVLRGRDHLANTELQSAIIRALGGVPPVYVHAALLTLPEGAKISKRAGEGAAAGDPLTIAGLRERGYPPAAVCNALALSLADFGTDELLLTLGEQARRFDLGRLHSADSRFDFDKLRWLSGQHIRALSSDELAAGLTARLGFTPPPPALDAARTAGANLEECADVVCDLLDPPEPDAAARALASTREAGVALVLLWELAPAPPADLPQAELLFKQIKDGLRERDVKLGPALRGLRAALTGRAAGPELPYVLATLSRERLKHVRDRA